MSNVSEGAVSCAEQRTTSHAWVAGPRGLAQCAWCGTATAEPVGSRPAEPCSPLPSAPFRVWRDGERIASSSRGGYNDLVPDSRLRSHADDPSLSPEDRAFASLVLAFRNFERVAAS